MGIRRFITAYHATRISFSIIMLNSDDAQVQQSARESPHLHMTKRKVAPAQGNYFPQKILDWGIIEPCQSSWVSPVLVTKTESLIGFCFSIRSHKVSDFT